MSTSESDPLRAESPGLTAAVYYLRPFDRDKLLSALAALGVFVHEQRWQASSARASDGGDLSIVVANPDDTGVVRSLAERTPLLLAVVDSPAHVASYLEAGARLCAVDEQLLNAPSLILAEAARMARRCRDGVSMPNHQSTSAAVDLGGALFSSQTCALVRGGASVPLSRAERDVLSCLAADPGTPVRSEALARAAQIRMFPTSRYLASVIVSLRRKLRRLGADAGALATVHGVGYVLLAPERSEESGP